MIQHIKRLLYPDDFRHDAYAWGCNQVAHGGIGMLATACLFMLGFEVYWAALWALLASLVLKECLDMWATDWRRSAMRDSLHDMLFRGAGALLFASAVDRYAIVFIPVLVAAIIGLAWGVKERLQ